MNKQEEAYKIVRDVLLDGEEHELAELTEALQTVMGLKRSQSTGRIHRMVYSEKIERSARGYYRLAYNAKNVKPTDASEQLIWSLNRIKSFVDTGITVSGIAFLQLSEVDMEILRSLQDIRNRVEDALEKYQAVKGNERQVINE